MATKKEFFEMKRHERRGTIMVLALIAVLLAVTFVVRNCRGVEQPVPMEDIRQFETDADSTTLMVPKPAHKKPAASRKKRRHAAPKPSKPAPAPRRLDPVPQI